tara:strand:+ start:538 stop:1302 length:765 start_codon:yes stop_codon:yes gene_type:complete
MTTKFILLGSGSSMGVPRIDGYFGKCDPKNIKNYRTRCSAIIVQKKNNILIDTSPDLRSQLINLKIKNIDKVLYTHQHADQTHGINELRTFYLKKGKKIPVYADKKTSSYLKRSFSYCFQKKSSYPPILDLKKLKKYIKFNDTLNIKSITVRHGNINCMSFIINKKLAYAPDVNEIYNKDLHNFKNLKYLVIDCLRITKHPSHFNLDDVLKLTADLKPKKTILTNMHSDLDYNQLLKILPKNIEPGFDGLTLNI